MEQGEKIRKMSINVPATLGRRVKQLAFNADVSESSIVEAALRKLIDAKSDAVLAKQLRREGATLRRPNLG
jgi:predicted transcriptional regulator